MHVTDRLLKCTQVLEPLKCIVFLDETYSKTTPKRLNLGFIGGT